MTNTGDWPAPEGQQPPQWGAPQQPAPQQPAPQAQPGQWAAPGGAAPQQPAPQQPAPQWGAPQQPAPQAQPGQWAAPGGAASQPGAEVPAYVAAPAEELGGGWHGPARIVGLLVGLVAFGALGFVAASSIFGTNTGAESADAAVVEMMEAMTQEDIVGMMNVMAPGEVGHAADLYPRIVQLIQQEGMLEGDNPLSGVNFEVEGLVTETVELHPDVGKVYLMEGTITMTIDPDNLDPALAQDWPEGAETEFEIDIADVRAELDNALDQAAWEAQQAANDFGFNVQVNRTSGLFMMSVKQNGRWYISPFYTAAEYGREILGLAPADFTQSREQRPQGADSAEGVFDSLEQMVNSESLQTHLAALVAGDPDGNFAELSVFIPPNELGVFLDYGPSYMDFFENLVGDQLGDLQQEQADLMAELQAELDKANVEGQLTINFDTSTEQVDGDLVKVYLDAGEVKLDATAVIDGEPIDARIELSWDRLCGDVFAQVNGEIMTDSGCADPRDLASDPQLEQFANEFDRVFVMVSRQNGSWYISYVETGLAYADLLIDSAAAAN